MRLFENVLFVQEPSSLVVPAGLATELAFRMRDEGIDFSYHAWDEVVRGKAPVPYDEAMDLLRPFEEMGRYSVAPCVIVSNVSYESMLQRCRWLSWAPDNPCGDLRDSAYGFVLPSFWEGAEVASLELCPQPRVIRRGGGVYAPLTQDEVLMARRMVCELAESDWLNDAWWYGEEPLGTVGLTTKELLENMTAYSWKGPLAQCATFPMEDIRDAFVREALAANAVSIVRWVCQNRTSKLLSLPVSMVLSDECCCDTDLPRGIVRTKRGGFLREIATESAIVGLRRIGQSGFGFAVESVTPDLAASTARETGTDLRKIHGPWHGYISATYEEYTCDPTARYPVTLLRKWVSDEDDEHVMLIEAPAKVPGTVVRVYIGWDTPWTVVTSDQTPRTVPCCYAMSCYGSDGESLRYLPASQGPTEWSFSSSLSLCSEKSYRTLEQAYPQVAKLARRLYRRALELRYEYFASRDATRANLRICRQLRTMLDHEVWPCIDRSNEESEEKSRFSLDSSQGVVASIARGKYAFEWGDARTAPLSDDPAEWTVEELDLSTATTRWLVYQVGAHTVHDLVELLADGLKDAPGYDFNRQIEIEKALHKVGLHAHDDSIHYIEMEGFTWDD